MTILKKPRLRSFTWHAHGSYLYYLSQGYHDIFIPIKAEKGEGYWGRETTFPFGDNVHEIPADLVRDFSFDLILFQSEINYRTDQYAVLSEAQRQLPVFTWNIIRPQDLLQQRRIRPTIRAFCWCMLHILTA